MRDVGGCCVYPTGGIGINLSPHVGPFHPSPIRGEFFGGKHNVAKDRTGLPSDRRVAVRVQADAGNEEWLRQIGDVAGQREAV